jgi:hypothetical protein
LSFPVISPDLPAVLGATDKESFPKVLELNSLY